MNFEGSCHCGAISYVYTTGLPVDGWSIRACQCSFCRGHAAVTTSDPNGALRFFENEAGGLQRYRFGLGITEFLLCGRCGSYLGAQMETAKGLRGIVNINAMRPPPDGLADIMGKNYDGESVEQRSRRREVGWTPVQL